MRFLSLMLVLACLNPVYAESSPWPQFRGPGASGVASGAKPPLRFNPQTNVQWKIPIGDGTSSPIIVGNKLFVTTFENGKLYTVALDRGDGHELWRKEAPAAAIEPYHKTENSPASGTCVTDGERIVSYFGSCGLFAYSLDGHDLWRMELPKAETGFDFGSGVSPVLADGLVILARDLKKDSKIIAVDVKTGSLAWEKKRDFPTGWSTPAIWDTPNGKQIALPGYVRMIGYDLKSGDEKWSILGMPAAVCTTPVVADGMLLYAGWSPGDDFKLPPFEGLLKDADKDGDGAINKDESENTFLKGFFDNNDINKDGKLTKEEWEAAGKHMSQGRNSAFAVKPGGSGDITKTHVVWKSTNKKILPYVPSALVYDGVYYLVKDGGLMSAFDIKTGKELYVEERAGAPGQYYASPVAANGHIYLTALNGDVTVVKAGEVPTVVFRGKLSERTAATPAIADDTLYVRTAKHLYAFREKK